MPTVTATWNALSGNWFSAANWNEPNPNPGPPPIVHHVPGAHEVAVIPNNSGVPAATPFTVTHNGTSTIDSLEGAETGTLDITSGALTLLNGGQYNSMKINVASGATLTTGGLLVVRGGTYAGTVAGAGSLIQSDGTYTIDAGARYTVANWVMGVSSIAEFSETTLNTDLTYANNFTLDDFGIVKLNGHSFTLSGTALLGGSVVGPGALGVTGTAQSAAGYGQLSFSEGAELGIASGGSFTQHYDMQVGGEGTTGAVVIGAGGTYRIDNTTTLGNCVTFDEPAPIDGSAAANGTVTNKGTFRVDGAAATPITATVAATMTSAGTIMVASGDTLRLAGYGSYLLGGAIAGAGRLTVGAGVTALTANNVSIANLSLDGSDPSGTGITGATLRLDTDISYGGRFSAGRDDDMLQLNGKTLTLSGGSNTLSAIRVSGPGTLKITGAATLGGHLALGFSYDFFTTMTLQNAGSITQISDILLNGTLQNDSGKTYRIAEASALWQGARRAIVINNGTFSVTAAGSSTVDGDFTNSGTLSVASGATLTLNWGVKTLGGTISGAGALVFDGTATNTSINTANVTVGSIALAGGKLTLGVDLTYAGKLTVQPQFQQLFLNGHTLTLSGSSNVLGGGRYSGDGTIRVTGKATVGGDASFGYMYPAPNPMTLVNDGAMTQNGAITLNGALTNNAGKTYTINTATSLYSTNGGGTITNNGTFADTGAGISDIHAKFINVGTLSVAAGATVQLRGGSTLGGTVSGAGAVAIVSSTAINGANLTVRKLSVLGGTTTLGADLAYAGAFALNQQFATLALNGKTLTLTGTTDFASGKVRGKSGQQDKLAIIGAAASLSAVVFVDWEATDIVSITGTRAANTLTGSSQNDTLAGLAGADALVGRGGIDTASYAASGTGVIVNLTINVNSGGDAQGDKLSEIENITGSNYIDKLAGDAGINRIEGGLGDDTLAGRAGPDVLIGGGGIDTASYATSSAGVTVNLATNVNAGGDAEGDNLSSIENVNGSEFADRLTGNSAANWLDGGAGADILDGGLGNDALFGGSGPDTFAFTTAPGASAGNVDTIADFTVGSDLIALSTAIYSALKSGSTPGSLSSSSFRTSTQASASGRLGEIVYDATTGHLVYDADGAGGSSGKQFATVSAGLALSASSFRLA